MQILKQLLRNRAENSSDPHAPGLAVTRSPPAPPRGRPGGQLPPHSPRSRMTKKRELRCSKDAAAPPAPRHRSRRTGRHAAPNAKWRRPSLPPAGRAEMAPPRLGSARPAPCAAPGRAVAPRTFTALVHRRPVELIYTSSPRLSQPEQRGPEGFLGVATNGEREAPFRTGGREEAAALVWARPWPARSGDSPRPSAWSHTSRLSVVRVSCRYNRCIFLASVIVRNGSEILYPFKALL